MSKTGELVDSPCPPAMALVNHFNARSRPARCAARKPFSALFLNQDNRANRLPGSRNEYRPVHMDAGHSSYRLDETKLAEAKLLTTKQSLPKTSPTLVRRNSRQRRDARVERGPAGETTDLAAATCFSSSDRQNRGQPGWCTDIWVGAETHKLATEQQQKKSPNSRSAAACPLDRQDRGQQDYLTPSARLAILQADLDDGLVAGKMCGSASRMTNFAPGIHRSMAKRLDRGSSAVPWRVTAAVGPPRRDGEQHLRRLPQRAHIRIFGPGWKPRSFMAKPSWARLRAGCRQRIGRAAAQGIPCNSLPHDYANDQLPCFNSRRVKPRRPLPSISFVASW